MSDCFNLPMFLIFISGSQRNNEEKWTEVSWNYNSIDFCSASAQFRYGTKGLSLNESIIAFCYQITSNSEGFDPDL